MKKIYFLVIFFAVSLSGWSQLLTEPFPYTVHATQGLAAQSNSVWLPINTGDSMLLDNGSLTYPGLAASTGNKVIFEGAGTDYYTDFATQNSGSVYSSFILNVSALGSLNTTGGYFAGFIQSGSTTSFGAAVWTRLSTTAGRYNVGISTRSNSAVNWLTTDLTPGTPCFIVIAYDIIAGTGNDVSRIWLNTAAIGGTEPAADATSVAAGDLTNAARFFLRQVAPAGTPFTEFDELRVGTTWASVTPSGAAAATLSATTLNAFGNICINTTAGPNSFTITGTTLTAANVTVGALAGFTYSTTAGGTYTTSLSLVQPGGAYSQDIFVQFTPTAVQSYNGNISLGGGGAPSINVAASGAGITAPTVTTGAASAVTQVSATLAGTITATGCTAVTAYGIEWSTTPGFANGTGTAVPSTNLSGSNFSSDLLGLTASTTYYYHAYAINGGGTGYGNEQSFTTSSASASGIVISQVYGGGGNSGATYTHDFIELFNRGTVAESLNGWSVQYNSGGSTVTPVWQITNLTNVTLQPGQYYLIQQAQGTGGTTALPTPDAIGTIAMGAASGKVALVNTTTILTGTSGGCPTPAASIIDFVGFGTSNCFEGTGSTALLSNTTAAIRALNGCTDTNNNTADFTAGAPNPRNTVTSLNVCGAATPLLSATTLTAFGSICINTTAAPNSFTITGTTLTAADVTVGPLSGFSFSTTAGGTYTASLSLPQPGGAYSQAIFVNFTPTAVQSYNGNIPVGGGGAPSINVAASGAGINTAPSVTTGAASAITQTTATLAGSIPSIGCSAISAYGVEYSTTSGFPNGTGTQAAATNLSGGNFSSNVAGLSAGTAYYYKAYATNAGGTTYGTEQTFTTVAGPSLSATALTAFGNVCINTTAGPNSFTITGSNLTAVNISVGPLAGFAFSTTAGGTYTASLNLAQPGGAYSQAIFVNFTPTAIQSYSGNIPVSGGGAVAINVAATGAGVNSIPGLTTGAASVITTTTATLAGSITSAGCSAVAAYGVEYSTTSGFANGSGTAVPSTNLSGGNFTSDLTGLSPNTTYYYHAYATNAAGTGYGAEQSFITQSLTPTLNATALTAFGNVCINTIAGPNSFTINGSALNTGNITVGPLTGFSFSTTAAGTYTASLSLTQPGGTFTQAVFVRFTPTLVQSYSGNIPVGGGGATTINVAASGSGINTIATVTSGAASAITSVSATLAGSIPATGCSAITAYGVEYSTVNGFPNGSGTAVAATNLTGGNFSSNLTGLTPATTYYYHAFVTNGGGTAYGAQQSFITATPVLTSGALTAFGNVCINTTAGPNSFTITGTNLTAANVAVGPLAGFGFSTTAAGTYTASLSLTQPGGAYSQAIFVNFTPVAIQSYNGNIPVNGGGASAINVAASGAGISTAASVTSGAASAITQTSATVAGTIPSIGCSAVTAYGIEYSTTNGFANGTGTAVASTNLTGINFSSALTGLAPATTYYYHAYAVNAGGTSYGVQASFTTGLPVLTATALTGFGATCINATAGPNSFTINSTAVLAANINVGPLNGYSFSTTAAGTYTASLSLTHPAGPYTQTIYVRFTPTAVQSYNGNIPVSGGGAATINVGATGSGVNSTSVAGTGNATVNSPNSVTLEGSVSNTGCSPVTGYGIEYSGISGLANGLGTMVPATNINAGNFSTTINGLVQGGTYYYKAYAVNSGGITYGPEKTFTTSGIPGGFVIYSNPVKRGGNLHYTYKGITPGHYQVQVFNSNGQLVHQREVITQMNFIEDNFTIPGHLPIGPYSLVIASPDFRVKKAFLVW